MARSVRSFLPLLLLLLGPVAVEAGRLLYSFRTPDGGGVAQVKVDEDSGRIEEHELLHGDGGLAMAKKVRLDADGRRWAVTTEQEAEPFLLLGDLKNDGTVPGRVEDMIDELRPWAQFFVTTSGDGAVSLVKTRSGKVHRRWKSRKALSPPGHRPEDVVVLPDGLTALVSFQKDGKKGRQGNRLVLLDLPKMTCLADFRLPRDHPELHVAGDPGMAGPGPEVILASAGTDGVLVTLDLYGAVAMFDLDALRQGELRDWTVLPTSEDGSWGTAFPDRAVLVPQKEGDLALVANAGDCGGLLLFDMRAKRLLRRWTVPPGLEAPVWLPDAELAASVRSGKHKRRVGDEIVKTMEPGTKLWLFPVGRARSSASVEARAVDLGRKTFLVEAVDPDGCDLLLVFVGEGGAEEMLVVDPLDGRVLDRAFTLGAAQRVERRR